ncbi:MAG: hypothetical protein P8Y37_01930 [Anaerolineales bacterium]
MTDPLISVPQAPGLFTPVQIVVKGRSSVSRPRSFALPFVLDRLREPYRRTPWERIIPISDYSR